MTIAFACSNCGTLQNVPDIFAGKMCKCATCAVVQTVPQANEQPQIASMSPAGRGVSTAFQSEPRSNAGNSSADPSLPVGEAGDIGPHNESAASRATWGRRLIRCLGGLAMMLGTGYLTIWNWQLAVNEGYYYHKASLAGPAFFVLGLAVCCFREEQIGHVYYVEVAEGLKAKTKLTPLGWSLVVVALSLAGLNWLLMMYVNSQP